MARCWRSSSSSSCVTFVRHVCCCSSLNTLKTCFSKARLVKVFLSSSLLYYFESKICNFTIFFGVVCVNTNHWFIETCSAWIRTSDVYIYVYELMVSVLTNKVVQKVLRNIDFNYARCFVVNIILFF